MKLRHRGVEYRAQSHSAPSVEEMGFEPKTRVLDYQAGVAHQCLLLCLSLSLSLIPAGTSLGPHAMFVPPVMWDLGVSVPEKGATH